MKIEILLTVLIRYIVPIQINASKKYLDASNFKLLDLNEKLKVLCHKAISLLFLDLHCIGRSGIVW